MNVISRLKKSGLTIPDIARALQCTEHTVRNYQRGRRFPERDAYRQLIELGESRGLLFTAEDFLADGSEHEAA